MKVTLGAIVNDAAHRMARQTSDFQNSEVAKADTIHLHITLKISYHLNIF